ncbi:MAG: RNA-binding S4 domain-containing protein [Clostridia bacterium]|nr:RNA-binding S4 domain-containing protein [Clostridia bacterium]
MIEIKISTPFIKLDQLLKYSGISLDGSEAKEIIKSGLVNVNGEKEERRGRKIYPDDLISINLEDEIKELKVI